MKIVNRPRVLIRAATLRPSGSGSGFNERALKVATK
jgi:hypothetical protein